MTNGMVYIIKWAIALTEEKDFLDNNVIERIVG